MRISGTEPSSVILSQVLSKVEKRCPKRAKSSWSQKGWCNKTHKITILNNFNTENSRRKIVQSINENRGKKFFKLV